MYVSRLLEEKIVRALKNHKVLFLLGARQVGKTTLLSHIFPARRGAMLNMDVEIDRARLLAASHLEPAQAIRTLGGEEVLVIDEAQRVPEIGRICKGWYDARVATNPVKVPDTFIFLTPSFSKSPRMMQIEAF